VRTRVKAVRARCLAIDHEVDVVSARTPQEVMVRVDVRPDRLRRTEVHRRALDLAHAAARHQRRRDLQDLVGRHGQQRVEDRAAKVARQVENVCPVKLTTVFRSTATASNAITSSLASVTL